jgi:hypothetical protein
MEQGTNNSVLASPESPIASLHSLNPIYSALPKSLSGQSKTIRMLKIHPGLPHASIECSLSVVDLETVLDSKLYHTYGEILIHLPLSYATGIHNLQHQT